MFKKPKNYSAEDNFQFRVESFGIFIFKDWVLLLTDSDIPVMDERKFSKIDSLNTFVLRVLSFAIAHFNEHLKIINRINDDLEQRLNTSMENKYLLSMFSLNKGLIYYVSALNSNDTLLRKLQLGRSLNWTEAERELLEDIQIENGQSLQQANIYANILTSMMDARASVINNNVNQLMKNLTIVTISISLPTFRNSEFGIRNENAAVVVAFYHLIQNRSLFEALFHKFSDAFFPVLAVHGVWELVVERFVPKGDSFAGLVVNGVIGEEPKSPVCNDVS